jgi:hypothetical protein
MTDIEKLVELVDRMFHADTCGFLISTVTELECSCGLTEARTLAARVVEEFVDE